MTDKKERYAALSRKIDLEFLGYEADMLGRSPKFLFAKAGEIAAMCFVYNRLTEYMLDGKFSEETENLLRCEEPLQTVCKLWGKEVLLLCTKEFEQALPSLNRMIEEG